MRERAREKREREEPNKRNINFQNLNNTGTGVKGLIFLPTQHHSDQTATHQPLETMRRQRGGHQQTTTLIKQQTLNVIECTIQQQYFFSTSQ